MTPAKKPTSKSKLTEEEIRQGQIQELQEAKAELIQKHEDRAKKIQARFEARLERIDIKIMELQNPHKAEIAKLEAKIRDLKARQAAGEE